MANQVYALNMVTAADFNGKKAGSTRAHRIEFEVDVTPETILHDAARQWKIDAQRRLRAHWADGTYPKSGVVKMRVSTLRTRMAPAGVILTPENVPEHLATMTPEDLKKVLASVEAMIKAQARAAAHKAAPAK